MILFDSVINFFESFLLVWFIAEFFDFKENKNAFIIVSTIIQFIILEISLMVDYYGIFLSVISAILLMICVYLGTKNLTMKHIYIILLQEALFAVYVVIGTHIFDIFTLEDMYIVECIMCKIMQLIGNIVILRFKNRFAITLEMSRWKIIIVYEIILIVLLYTTFYGTLFNIKISLFEEINILMLFILCIMFMYIVNLINEEHDEKMKLLKDKQNEEFQRQKYYAISNIKSEIESLDHRLFYTIYKIEEQLHKQDYQSIENIIDYYKNQVLKHKLAFDTGNHVFDTLYSVKINELVMDGINISNIVLINRNDFYDDLRLINFIQIVLDYFRNCQYLKISFVEADEFILFRIIYRDGTINIDQLKMFLDDNQWLSVVYNINEHQIKGVRISIKMDQDNDKKD